MRTLTTIAQAPRRTSGKPKLRGLRAALAELDPATIEQIAQRVAQLLHHSETHTPRGLIDAAELARRTGLSRAWIYEHADLLGAIKIGTGPKPRLRFDPQALGEAILAPEPARTPLERARSRRRPAPSTDNSSDADLLPIHPPSRRS